MKNNTNDNDNDRYRDTAIETNIAIKQMEDKKYQMIRFHNIYIFY